MDSRFLSVVIPTYQRRDLLAKAIDSLVQQGKESISIVISDNASTDGTEDYVRSLDLPVPLTYLRNEENIGICRNFYQASKAAQGKYQLWLTDDDFLLPNSLDLLLSSIRQNEQCGYFFSHVHCIPEGGTTSLVIGPAEDDLEISPGVQSVAQYARYGWVYSRQVLRTDWIDWGFWERNLFNAYIPVLISGRMLLERPAHYFASSIVGHTIENECHWEEFGEDKFHIMSRTQADYRRALPAILQDQDCSESRQIVREWQQGCDELFLQVAGTTLSQMTRPEAYRAIRSGYADSPAAARDLVKRHSQKLRRRLLKSRIKRQIKRTVGVNNLPERLTRAA